MLGCEDWEVVLPTEPTVIIQMIQKSRSKSNRSQALCFLTPCSLKPLQSNFLFNSTWHCIYFISNNLDLPGFLRSCWALHEVVWERVNSGYFIFISFHVFFFIHYCPTSSLSHSSVLAFCLSSGWHVQFISATDKSLQISCEIKLQVRWYLIVNLLYVYDFNCTSWDNLKIRLFALCSCKIGLQLPTPQDIWTTFKQATGILITALWIID